MLLASFCRQETVRSLNRPNRKSWCRNTTLRIMQLTGVLLLACSISLSARSVSQTITFKGENVPLEKVLKVINQQTGYLFITNQEEIRQANPVTVDAKDVALTDFLSTVLGSQPFEYLIKGKSISIKRKVTADFSPRNSSSDLLKPTPVTGIVRGSDGQPIPGANIMIKGTKRGTTTDNDGRFTINADEGNVLEISAIGFGKKEIKINGSQNIIVALDIATSVLDEVQYIAYGQTTRRYSVGNTATVKASDIAKQPVNNPLLALQGRVPGLFITQASGFAGSGVKVRIQGQNSLAGGNDPLYVIDGIPYVSQLLPSVNAIQGSSGGTLVSTGSKNFATFGNPLSYLNPADIESIEVLKDADATAIYGSQAANGALLITTKKGKAGEQRIEFNLQQGWGRVTRKMDLLDRRQYLDMRYEALKNDGISLSSLNTNSNYDLTVWDTTRSTDWQKQLIGNTAHYTDLQTRVSGGTANSSYNIGAGYHKETTVIPGHFNDQKANVLFQVGSTSSNQKFKLRLSANYMVDINRLPENPSSSDLTALAMQLAPVAPLLYNADGSLNWAFNPAGISTWDYPGNPLAQLLQKYTGRTNNLVSNALLSYQIIPGLSIKSSFGYTNMQVNESGTVPEASIVPENRASYPRTALYGNSYINSWIIEPQANYEKNIFGGKLEVLLGSTIQQRSATWQKLIGLNYINDNVMNDIHAAGRIESEPSFDYTYKYNAAFGRINYAWNQKYLLDLTGRRDGSSRFGAQNRFHNFWSVGGAWIFTQEKMINDLFPFLSFGKIKASYGTTGSDQLGEYQYLSVYNPVSAGNPYQGINTLQNTSLSNAYLQWEETKKFYAGLNLGFFKDRILIDASYYRNRSSNQLLGYQLPITTGFTSITENFPATIQNTGFEFSANTCNIQSKNFRWSSTINFTIPKNKLVAFPGIESSTYTNNLVVGEPTTIVKRYHLVGVDPGTGIYYFNSKTDPFNPQPPNDASVIINTSPCMYGGIENSFSYKGLQLDFLFQAVKQKGPNYFYGRFPGAMRLNQPIWVLDRWQKPGDASSHQSFNSDYSLSGQWMNAATYSDASYSDASYVRLKNVSVSWKLPDKYKGRMNIHGLRVFTQGQNLLTFTKYKGLDPETMSSTTLPPMRVITVGVQITL